MMVIFLVGLVSMILMRTLRKDYARYSKEDDIDDMEKDLGDEYGWKQVNGYLIQSEYCTFAQYICRCFDDISKFLTYHVIIGPWRCFPPSIKLSHILCFCRNWISNLFSCFYCHLLRNCRGSLH